MTNIRNIKWSKTEKTITRRAFDSAYRREHEAIIHRLSWMLQDITHPEDLWCLHDFLSKKRQEIDEKYDYRYSVLLWVFARLMAEGWLQQADLEGLHAEKVTTIRFLANM